MTPAKQHLAACAEASSFLGMRVRQVGTVYAVGEKSIIGPIATGKRGPQGWVEWLARRNGDGCGAQEGPAQVMGRLEQRRWPPHNAHRVAFAPSDGGADWCFSQDAPAASWSDLAHGPVFSWAQCVGAESIYDAVSTTRSPR
jgi:hypothetical protein